MSTRSAYTNIKLSSIRILSALLTVFILLSTDIIKVHATQDELNAAADQRRTEEPDSNSIPSWPQGPHVSAEGAIVMEADTGTILYSKHADEKLYPASITKLMCCLVAVENCSLDETISVNQSAIDANQSDGSNMGLKAGESFTLEELLYGILINSANEACNAVAEHIAGSIDDYVVMMNERAAELGCTGTHFVTPNGLYDKEHYTTPHDMALIGRAFFSHSILCNISSTPRYTISANGAHEEHPLHSKNKLYKGGEYEYPDLVGSKTGFTSEARQTLVSCAERGGLRLIAVVMMEESPTQFTDTRELFEYGFSSFSLIDPAEYETGYAVSNSSFFNSTNGIFGSTAPLLRTAPSSIVVIPNTLKFSDLSSDIGYDNLNEGALARINYSYEGIPLGSTDIILNASNTPSFDFEMALSDGSPIVSGGSVSAALAAKASGDASVSANSVPEKKIYLNIYNVLKMIGIGIAAAALLYVLSIFLRKYFIRRRRLSEIKKSRSNVIKNRRLLRKNFKRGRHEGPSILSRKSSKNTRRRPDRDRRPYNKSKKNDAPMKKRVGEKKNNRDNFKFPY